MPHLQEGPDHFLISCLKRLILSVEPRSEGIISLISEGKSRFQSTAPEYLSEFRPNFEVLDLGCKHFDESRKL